MKFLGWWNIGGLLSNLPICQNKFPAKISGHTLIVSAINQYSIVLFTNWSRGEQDMETEQELHLEETEEIHGDGPAQRLVPAEVHVDGGLQNTDRDLQREGNYAYAYGCDWMNWYLYTCMCLLVQYYADPFRKSSTSVRSAKSEQGHQRYALSEYLYTYNSV